MYHTVKVYTYSSYESYCSLLSKQWKFISIVHMSDYSKGPDPVDMKDDRRIYLSICSDWSQCKWLNSQDLKERSRWIHYSDTNSITEDAIYNCMLAATEPTFNTDDIDCIDNEVPDNPLVTVYSSTYNSQDKILKPFKSLVKQTYKNWEWIIVDDSTNTDTWNKYLKVMHQKLPNRVKVYDTEGTSMSDYLKDSREYKTMHCGLIGKMKGLAVSKGTGHILLELDHDDELEVSALQRIVDAFLRNKSVGFVYSSFCELHDKSLEPHTYGHDFAYGYGTYWNQWSSALNTVVCPMISSRLNAQGVTHLVGLPNHPRAWTRSAYNKAGGYRSSLLVADDYDLLIRTFLTNKYAEITDLLYYQYRYPQTNTVLTNVTMSRNAQIQVLTNRLFRRYYDRLMKRCSQLGLPLQIRHMPYKNILDTDDSDPRNLHATVIDYNGGIAPKIVFYHISLNATGNIQISQDYIDDPNVVICIFVEEIPNSNERKREQLIINLSKELPDGKVKWRVVHPGLSIDGEKKWAKYIHGVDSLLTEIIM